MQVSYLTSVSSLKHILSAAADENARFRVINGDDIVTVIQYGPSGVLHQASFPVAYRIPEVSDEEGTLLLMIATERGRTWNSFWVPVEAHVSKCSAQAPA